MSELNSGEQFLVNALADAIGRQRMLYAGRPGNTKRTKLYEEFGYPDQLGFEQYYRAYERNPVAYAAVHKLLESCWTDKPTIIDGAENKESTETTIWEKAATRLLSKHWAKIKDADRRNLVGRYSALLIQFKDGREWKEPVDTSVVKRLRDKSIVKLIPAWESQIKPGNFDTDTMSETYGEPVSYQFNEQPVGDDGSYGPVRSVTVHPDRVIILCEGSEDDNMLSGVPFLRAGYNKLLDLEKISGGSAEGFLKNASRQLGISFDAATDMKAIADMAKQAGYESLGEAMNDKMMKLNRGTDSALVTQSGTTSVLSVAAADPAPSWTVTANEFSSSIQCPFASGNRLRKFRPVPHLLGRRFEHGSMDCYTLFRDAYHLCGIDLPEFERTNGWWVRGENLYLKNMAANGFFEVNPADILPGDVIIRRAFPESDPCHAMLWLGDNTVLHHELAGRLSRREPYRQAYVTLTHSIWRHEQCSSLDLRGISDDISAKSL